MRIAIIGPGAVGTTIAYEFQQVLPHITLLGRTNKSIHFQPANQHIIVKDIKSMTDPSMLLSWQSKHINLNL